MPAAPTPVMPAPVTPAKTPAAAMPAAPPADFFRRKTIDLVAGGDRRMRIIASRRQPFPGERLRHQGRGLCACGQRSRAGGKSKGEFQKMAAFHDISRSGHCGVMRRDFARGEMNAC